MQRFFLPLSAKQGGSVIFSDAETVHQLSRVFRFKAGDRIISLFNDGEEHVVELQAFSKKEVVGKILESKKNENELVERFFLFQALPKSKEKWEFIVQKAVELGVTDIVPLKSSRSTAKYPSFSDRLEKIIKEASEQSERGNLLQIHEMCLVENISQYQIKNLFVADSYDESAQNLLQVPHFSGDVGICIGPEGGFSLEEVQCLQSFGAQSVGLGKRILRLETAMVLAVGALMLKKEC